MRSINETAWAWFLSTFSHFEQIHGIRAGTAVFRPDGVPAGPHVVHSFVFHSAVLMKTSARVGWPVCIVSRPIPTAMLS